TMIFNHFFRQLISRLVAPKRYRSMILPKFGRDRGLTLVELIVASALIGVVILVGWTGLLSIMNMTQTAEARTARQTELNRALDFMTSEIRMARYINRTATVIADGATVTLPNVVTSSGLSLASLGTVGTISLYLERPTQTPIPATCPAGGPNAGLAPPAPASYDRVVYDVRPSPSGWLGPRILMRYGRVPSGDGTINPCKSPVSSDPMVDALPVSITPPTCSGLLSGAGGFYSCVKDNHADLFFQSAVSNVSVKRSNTSVSSRLINITPELTLKVNRPNTNTLNFSWDWSNGGSASTYTLKRIWQGNQSTLYTGANTSFAPFDLSFASSGDPMQFWVTAQVDVSTTADSNTVAITK
ncbi:MAG: prepilin-type N-terminal cleavage/methylation domain-containing protein, partial [Thermosynechococcaceae cyanobacterium]